MNAAERRALTAQFTKSLTITKRQIASAARRIWGRNPLERSDGRGTIRAVLSALRIKHEK